MLFNLLIKKIKQLLGNTTDNRLHFMAVSHCRLNWYR